VKLSVVIPCYNAAATIGAQLDALQGQRWGDPWEIVVADNRSTDGSRDIVEGYRRGSTDVPIRIVAASERQGQPYALNTGAAEAVGESVAFCDADDEVAPGWVAAMGRALERHDFVGCRVETAKLNPRWVYESVGRHAQAQSLQTIPYPPYLPFAGGGTIGIKKWLHDAVGGFDEALPYVHDSDYCFRAQRLGATLTYVPDAVTHLRLRHSIRGIFDQARLWAAYNVKVYKRYRVSNGPDLKHPWIAYGYRWMRLVRLLPRIGDARTRVQAMWLLGYQIGLLHGSLKEHVPPVPN